MSNRVGGKEQMTECYWCGAELATGRAICDGCGRPTRPVAPSSSSSVDGGVEDSASGKARNDSTRTPSSCQKCGNQLGNSRFCTRCGAPVGTTMSERVSPESNQQTRSSGGRLRWILIASAIVLVVGGSFVAIVEASHTSSPEAAVSALVAAVNGDNVSQLLSEIDPGDRPPAPSGASVGGALAEDLLSGYSIKGFRVLSQSIRGSRAWVTIAGEACFAYCSSSFSAYAGGPTGIDGLIVDLLGDETGANSYSYPSGNVVPCEKVGGTWYVYAGQASWASNPGSRPPTVPSHRSAPKATKHHSTPTATTAPPISGSLDGVPASFVGNLVTYSLQSSSYTLAITTPYTESCYVKVTNAEGQVLYAQVLAPDEFQQFALTGDPNVELGAPKFAAVYVNQVRVFFPSPLPAPIDLDFRALDGNSP